MLAGISADYYLRLEQGRDHHPSDQVIAALARALRLDDGATAHLHALARTTPTKRRAAERERAPASIERLIASWPHTPAFVWGRHMDILAANALVMAISPVFSPGVNLVRATFLDPEVRRLVDDWEDAARSTVARLRALVGPDVGDPDLAALVSELSEHSEPFRRLWARHDIQIAPIATRTFNHPVVGPLDLKPERLAIIGAEGQVLIVYHAEAGSRSERALMRLARRIAGTPRPRKGTKASAR
jgi:transcriptional regulator with XRE-family HTH domain